MTVLIIYIAGLVLVSGFVGRYLALKHGFSPETDAAQTKTAFTLGVFWPIAPLLVLLHIVVRVVNRVLRKREEANSEYEAKIQAKVLELRAQRTTETTN